LLVRPPLSRTHAACGSQGFAPIPLKLPKILGEDVSGVVLEAPTGSKARWCIIRSHSGRHVEGPAAAAFAEQLKAKH